MTEIPPDPTLVEHKLLTRAEICNIFAVPESALAELGSVMVRAMERVIEFSAAFKSLRRVIRREKRRERSRLRKQRRYINS